MVKVLLIAALGLCTALKADSLTTTADSQGSSLSGFFEKDFPLVNPDIPQTQGNHPVEDFAVVSIISLPFAALYSFLGAAIYESINQNQFPPVMETSTLAAAGGVALGSSLLIATFSTQWGSGKKKEPAEPETQTDFKDIP